MKYKAGDRVKVKSQDWYKFNSNDDGEVDCGKHVFSSLMLEFCGKVVTITGANNNEYDIEEDSGYFFWTDDMFEGLADEENVLESIDKTADLLPKYVKTTRDMNTEQTELDITEEYEYVDDMGNVIDTKKIIIRKKKPKYPTTYEECCEILDIIDNKPPWHGYRSVQLKIFQKLLICRDAYWKIAGEEMGLGKSWKPVLIDEEKKYTIYNERHKVQHSFYQYHNNRILIFPTFEMRDAFYENFKDLINECKELL